MQISFSNVFFKILLLVILRIRFLFGHGFGRKIEVAASGFEEWTWIIDLWDDQKRSPTGLPLNTNKI